MNFTQAQQRAITTTSEDCLVIAGAGSGKTRVLVERIRYLIQSGASPADFLVLTFTRKAAREMRERLLKGLVQDGYSENDPQIRSMFLGTFHALALRMLKTDGERLGYKPHEITILDPDDADLILMRVCRDLGYQREKKWRGGVTWNRINSYREKFYTGQLDDDGEDPVLGTIFREYRSRLFEMNTMDFGSILRDCQRLLTEHPEVLKRYQQRFQYVIVDELQDTDQIQFNLHEFFAPPAEFFGVGDFSQSIYGWRGARPDLINQQHADAEVIQLRECFRCGNAIVEAANALISQNTDTTAEPMLGAAGKEGSIETLAGSLESIVETIGNLRGEGFGLRDIAVMARNHRTLKRLHGMLRESDVPVHRVGASFDVCGTRPFRKLHAAMKLAVNPADDAVFLRLTEDFELTDSQYAEIRSRAARERISHFQAMRELCCPSELKEAIMAGHGFTGKADLFLEKVIETYGEQSYLFAPSQRFWRINCSGMDLEEALQWYSLRDSQDDLPRGDFVTLLTAHAAKGLEFPCCIVAGLNEGQFPSGRAIREDPALLEERRVAYVAITRPAEKLILHYRTETDVEDEYGVGPASRFIPEAGLELMEAE